MRQLSDELYSDDLATIPVKTETLLTAEAVPAVLGGKKR